MRIKKHQMLDFFSEYLETENLVNEKRIHRVKISGSDKKPTFKSVVYLVTREFRYFDNFALNYARDLSEKNGVPFLTIFKVPQFENENENKKNFFQRNFEETKKDFKENKIDYTIYDNKEEIHPNTLLVIDFNPIEENFALNFNNVKNIIEIDGHNIVPARFVSDKQEYNAATIRRKIYYKINEFLTEFPQNTVRINEPLQLLKEFIEEKLTYYSEFKNDPTKNVTSGMSGYLNFGFIPSQRIALEVLKSDASRENKELFLEELIVRKELSDNFCFYCKDFKTLKCIPDWAKTTLKAHQKDIRTELFSLEELENAQSYDALWNASQNQLKQEGKIAGYLRMYWAKKIAQWSTSPESALETAIYLNDKYGYDAPSPNGYTGILWSIGALHDRAFAERMVTGKIRTMTYEGAKRKFDIEEYIKKYS